MPTPTRRSRPIAATGFPASRWPPHRRLLVISNGHGEDSIAAEIIRRLPADITVDAYPTLGNGLRLSRASAISSARDGACPARATAIRGSLSRDAARRVSAFAPALRFMRSGARRLRRHPRRRRHARRRHVLAERQPQCASISTSTSPATPIDYSALERWLICGAPATLVLTPTILADSLRLSWRQRAASPATS